MAKRFVGKRGPSGGPGQVMVVDENGERPLKHFRLHSPDGFQWGYGGSGPADLARSMCAEVMGHVPSGAIYQHVKFELIAPITEDEFELPASRVLDSIARAQEQRHGSVGR